jgi:hypothetical protein
MGMTFTEQEIQRKIELRKLIAANPDSSELSSWNAELRDIVTAARARMIQRAEQRRVKAEEKADEAVEIVTDENDLYTYEEKLDEEDTREQLQELRAEIEKARGKNKARLQDEQRSLVTEQIDRFNRAKRRGIKLGKCLPTPQPEPFQSGEEFEETMQWYRLDLAEAACYRKLNSPKTSFNLRRDVQKELERIDKLRRELRPEDYESKSKSPSPEPPALDSDNTEPVTDAKPAPFTDCSRLSDTQLREAFSKQRFFFRDLLGFADRGSLIGALETEIRRRKLQLVWSIEGTDQYVDEAGLPVHDLSKTVFMGRIPNPHATLDAGTF